MAVQALDAGVKPARQRRSARTRDAILQVLEDALADGSLDRLTVQDIVRLAGCSIGAFYGRFEDKDAAIAGLYARRRTGFIEKLEGVNEGASSLEIWAHAAVALALNHAVSNRALLARAATRDKASATIYADARIANLEMVDQVALLLNERFSLALEAEKAASAGAFALALIGAMARDAAVYSTGLLDSDKTRAWLIEQLAAAVISYLRACS